MPVGPKLTALLAVPASGVAGIILGHFYATPETLTQLIIGGKAAAAAAVALSILLLTPWLKSIPSANQTTVIWLIAGATTIGSCLSDLVTILLNHWFG